MQCVCVVLICVHVYVRGCVVLYVSDVCMYVRALVRVHLLIR